MRIRTPIKDSIVINIGFMESKLSGLTDLPTYSVQILMFKVQASMTASAVSLDSSLACIMDSRPLRLSLSWTTYWVNQFRLVPNTYLHLLSFCLQIPITLCFNHTDDCGGISRMKAKYELWEDANWQVPTALAAESRPLTALGPWNRRSIFMCGQDNLPYSNRYPPSSTPSLYTCVWVCIDKINCVDPVWSHALSFLGKSDSAKLQLVVFECLFLPHLNPTSITSIGASYIHVMDSRLFLPGK